MRSEIQGIFFELCFKYAFFRYLDIMFDKKLFNELQREAIKNFLKQVNPLIKIDDKMQQIANRIHSNINFFYFVNLFSKYKQIKNIKFYSDTYTSAIKEMLIDTNIDISDTSINNLFYPDIKLDFKKGEIGHTDFLLVIEYLKGSFNKKKVLKDYYLFEIKNNSTIFTDNYLDSYLQKIATIKELTVIDAINLENISIKDLITKEFSKKTIENTFKIIKHLVPYTRSDKKIFQAFSYLKSFLNLNGIDENLNMFKIIQYDNILNREIKFSKEELKELSKNIHLGEKVYKSNKKEDFYKFVGEIFKEDLGNSIVDSTIKFYKQAFKSLKEKDIFSFSEEIKLNGDDYYILDNNLRNSHSKEIDKAIKTNQNCLLTGNPGIGKTTSVFKSIESIDNLFLLYASPRNFINQSFFKSAIKNILKNSTNESAILKTDSKYTNISICNKIVSFFIIDTNSTKLKNFILQNYPSSSIAEIKETITNKLPSLENNIFSCCGYIYYPILEENVSKIDFSKFKKSTNSIVTYDSKDTQHMITVNNNKYVAIADILYHVSYAIKEYVKDISIYIISTLQALKYKSTVLEKKRFLAKFKKRIIFLDEITGEEGSFDIIKDILNKYEDEENKRFIKIFSDASITDNKIFIKLYKDYKTNQILPSRFFISNNNEVKDNSVKLEKFEIEGNKFLEINVSSFPATTLTIKFNHLFTVSPSLKKQIQRKTLSFIDYNEKKNYYIKLIKDYIKDNQKPIVFIQDKTFIKNLYVELKNIYNVIKITSDEKESERAKIKEKIENGNYDIALITSSASRGIDFPYTSTIVIEITDINIEENLLETIQTVYRMRGNANNQIKELRDKRIVFVTYSTISEDLLSQNDFLSMKTFLRNKKILNYLFLLSLIKNSLYTRIGIKKDLKKQITPIGTFKNNKITNNRISFFSEIIYILLNIKDDDFIRKVQNIMERYVNNIKTGAFVSDKEKIEFFNFIRDDLFALNKDYFKILDNLKNRKRLNKEIFISRNFIFIKISQSYNDFLFKNTKHSLIEILNESIKHFYKSQKYDYIQKLNIIKEKLKNIETHNFINGLHNNSYYVAIPIDFFIFKEFEHFDIRDYAFLIESFLKRLFYVNNSNIINFITIFNNLKYPAMEIYEHIPIGIKKRESQDYISKILPFTM